MKSSDIRSATTSANGSIVPIAIWLVLQVLAILLAALRIPLWLHAPEVGESLAIHILITVQILAVSLLFTELTSSWRGAAMTVATVWPFFVLAGLLANAPTSTTLRCGAYVSGWILVLCSWNFPLSTTAAKMTAISMAFAWAAAGPVLLFLGYEYAAVPLSPPTPALRAAMGPLLNAFEIANSEPAGKFWPWMMLVTGGGVALVISIVKVARRSRRILQAKSLNQSAV